MLDQALALMQATLLQGLLLLPTPTVVQQLAWQLLLRQRGPLLLDTLLCTCKAMLPHPTTPLQQLQLHMRHLFIYLQRPRQRVQLL